MDAVIISGGNVEDSILLDLCNNSVSNDLYIIAADKGLEACIRLAVKPDFIIGDFDSANSAALEYAKNSGIAFEKLNPIKDDTDTEAALNIAFDNSDGDIYLLGATGTRLDHVAGNFSLLMLGLERGRNVIILDKNNRIRIINHSMVLSKDNQYGRFVSVVPWSGVATGVNMSGFKYETKDFTFCCDKSRGISNEIVENEARITVDSGYLLVFETLD